MHALLAWVEFHLYSGTNCKIVSSYKRAEVSGVCFLHCRLRRYGCGQILKLVKTDKAQIFHFVAREIEWLTFGALIKAEDESPFPALTQFEIYGVDKTIRAKLCRDLS